MSSVSGFHFRNGVASHLTFTAPLPSVSACRIDVWTLEGSAGTSQQEVAAATLESQVV